MQPITFHADGRVWIEGHDWLTDLEVEIPACLDGFSSATDFLAFHEPTEGMWQAVLIEWRASGADRAMATVPDWRPAYLAVLADLRRARAACGLTQADVAASLGTHMRTLRRLETGEGDPPPGMLFRWAAVVGVELKSAHGRILPPR